MGPDMTLSLRGMPRWTPRLPTNYQEQTHASPYRIVRYTHLMRFKFAVDELAGLAPKRLLDYGTGDGFLIHELHKRLGSAMPAVVAYEPAADEPLLAEVVRSHLPASQ